jgi:glycerophosphoryl diester phosphodiesterase
MIVAHRGASADRPEHTMAAYALALAQGAGGVECDVRLTSDGQLVCVHDRTVNRTSDGRGAVSAMTMARMSTLDFGGERGVLSLDALLGLVADVAAGTTVFVETKHPVRYGGLVETKLVASLARHGLAAPRDKADSRVVVMSFSARAVRRVREDAPALPTVLLLNSLRRSVIDGWLPPFADVAGPGVRLLRRDPGYVDRARAHGHDTYVWTVDDPADVDLCRRLGVRYVATNSPARTGELLAG